MIGDADWSNAFLQAALAFARRGWPVFPCSPEDKKPLVKKGFKSASFDEQQIRAWWRQWPGALIGMVPASVRAFVVDLDPKGEPVDQVELRLEAAIGGPLPDGPRTITQSGGRHLWFARPAGKEFGNHRPKLKNIDIRCDNGYVILPPSRMTSGKTYEWDGGGGFHSGDELPPVPQKLLELIEAAKDKSGSAAAPTVAAAPAKVFTTTSPAEVAKRRYARAALDSMQADAAAAPEGQRGGTLFKASAQAGRFVAAGVLSEREALGALEDAAEVNGLVRKDGLAHVRHEIRNGIKTGMADAGELIRKLDEIGREAEDKARRAAARPPPPGGPDDYGMGAAASGEAPQPHEPESGGGGGSAPPPGPPEGGDAFDPDAVKDCARLEQNDADNGQRLIRHFGKHFIIVRDVGEHVWSGTHWEAIGGKEALERFAQRTAKAIAREALLIEASKADRKILDLAEPLKARPYEDLTQEEKQLLGEAFKAEGRLTKRRGDRRKFAISCGNRARTVAMIAQAAAHKTVTQDQLDRDPVAINCLNGVIRWSAVDDLECPDPDIRRRIWSRAFTAGHDPADLMSKCVGVAYEPEAKCPRWIAFLERFQPLEEQRHYIQKSHGYAMTGLTAVQALNFHYGEGSNGKSVFITTVSRVMGTYAALIPFASLVSEQQRRSDQANPDIIRLPRVRLAHAAEPPKNMAWDEALVKQLTGGEPMLARGLFQGFIEFLPIFKLAVFGNEKPKVTGVDHGIWRRLRVVPWLVTIDEREARDLADVVAELMEEAPGILNWLLEGLRLYFAEGLRPPPSVIEATKEYRAENDPIASFINAHVTRVEPAEAASVTAHEAYEAYLAWAEVNGEAPIKQTRFGRLMPQKGFKRADERVRRYLDIRLHDVPPRSPKGGSESLF